MWVFKQLYVYVLMVKLIRSDKHFNLRIPLPMKFQNVKHYIFDIGSINFGKLILCLGRLDRT